MENQIKRGGVRPNSGRPANDRSVQLLVRITKESADKLRRLTTNKSEYIDNLIKEQPEWRGALFDLTQGEYECDKFKNFFTKED